MVPPERDHPPPVRWRSPWRSAGWDRVQRHQPDVEVPKDFVLPRSTWLTWNPSIAATRIGLRVPLTCLGTDRAHSGCGATPRLVVRGKELRLAPPSFWDSGASSEQGEHDLITGVAGLEVAHWGPGPVGRCSEARMKTLLSWTTSWIAQL